MKLKIHFHCTTVCKCIFICKLLWWWVNRMLIVTGAPGCSVIKEAIMRQASERKTGSLSENKNLLGRLCGAHTNFNCLLLSQSSHPACPPYTDATRSPFSRLQRKKEEQKHVPADRRRIWQPGNTNEIKFATSRCTVLTRFPLFSKETDWFPYDQGRYENEWGAKRLREGCVKNIDGTNPFTPPPSPGAGAKTQREAWVSSRCPSQHTWVQHIHVVT